MGMPIRLRSRACCRTTRLICLPVFLSCARPGRLAAKVSPVEAVRYTEGGGSAKKQGKRSAKKGASLPKRYRR